MLSRQTKLITLHTKLTQECNYNLKVPLIMFYLYNNKIAPFPISRSSNKTVSFLMLILKVSLFNNRSKMSILWSITHPKGGQREWLNSINRGWRIELEEGATDLRFNTTWTGIRHPNRCAWIKLLRIGHHKMRQCSRSIRKFLISSDLPVFLPRIDKWWAMLSKTTLRRVGIELTVPMGGNST